MEFEYIFLKIFTSETINIFVVCISIISDIFELFIVLIFLEIVELRFCGLSYNTKRNIEERALNEAILSTEIITLPEENDMVDEIIE